MFKKIKKWYAQGLWTKEMVANAAGKGLISAEQYEEITGEPYESGAGA
ncbi:MAG: XkdX family protein [Ruminococcaceae bacterium]|nr:XkdX family protein [Oscillospiraceae bacterium]